MRLVRFRALAVTFAAFVALISATALEPFYTPTSLYSQRIQPVDIVPPVAEPDKEIVIDTPFEEEAPAITDDAVSAEDIAYGLYIDGVFVCACTDKSAIDTALDKFLSLRSAYYGVEGVTDAEFANTVEITQGRYPDDCTVDSGDVASLLGIESDTAATFAVTDVYGDLLLLDISVVTYAHQEGNEVIKYETENVYTDSKRNGTTSVVTKGSDGEAYVVCDRTYVNGELVGTEYIKNEVIKEPVNEVLMIGIADKAMDTAAFEGFFGTPTDSGYCISSSFGGRELNGAANNHSGIDIVKRHGSCNKEPAYASADGVVIYASRRGTYGNLVVIKHTDRISTYYAHLSSISVSVGDVVTQGQEIGRIGSTGRSTGPHLHFEIRIDDTPVNPLKFVTYNKA